VLIVKLKWCIHYWGRASLPFKHTRTALDRQSANVEVILTLRFYLSSQLCRWTTRKLAWSGQGSIQFNSITALHSANTKPVLDGLSLNIKAGEKIAICGRTGSGKSSLLLTFDLNFAFKNTVNLEHKLQPIGSIVGVTFTMSWCVDVLFMLLYHNCRLFWEGGVVCIRFLLRLVALVSDYLGTRMNPYPRLREAWSGKVKTHKSITNAPDGTPYWVFHTVSERIWQIAKLGWLDSIPKEAGNKHTLVCTPTILRTTVP